MLASMHSQGRVLCGAGLAVQLFRRASLFAMPPLICCFAHLTHCNNNILYTILYYTIYAAGFVTNNIIKQIFGMQLLLLLSSL